jgi:hypothetical protein
VSGECANGFTHSVSGVLAADHADVLLASNGTSALLTGRNSSSERVVSLGALVVTATLIAVNLGGDINGSPCLARAVGVDHAWGWISQMWFYTRDKDHSQV